MVLGLEKTTQEAARIVKEIRDVPYFAGGNNLSPDDLFIDMKGTCYRKHSLAAKVLQSLGYRTWFSFYEFDWLSLPFDEMTKLALGEKLIEHHMALKYRLGPYAGDLDITFDNKLSHAGFVVNEWDGKNGTALSIAPVGPERIYSTGYHRFRSFASAKLDSLKNLIHMVRHEKLEQENWQKNSALINEYLVRCRAEYME